MAELVVIGYPNEISASNALAKLETLQQDLIVDLVGASVVTSDASGKVSAQTPTHSTGAGATSGALWGVIFGLLFLIPVAGLVVGGAMGALFGKIGDLGIKKEYVEQVRDLLKPNTAALVIFYRKVTPDKTMKALAPYGGHVLKSSLSEETEKALDQALQHEVAGSAT